MVTVCYRYFVIKNKTEVFKLIGLSCQIKWKMLRHGVHENGAACKLYSLCFDAFNAYMIFLNSLSVNSSNILYTRYRQGLQDRKYIQKII